MQVFEVLASKHPENAEALGYLGRARIGAGQFSQAEKDLREALGRIEHPGFRFNHASLALYLNDSEGYEQDCQAMLPHIYDVVDALGFARKAVKVCALAPNRLANEDLIAAARLGAQRDANYVGWYRMNLGMAQFRSSHYEDSLETFAKVDSKMERSAVLTFHLFEAMAHFRMGHHEEGQRLFTEVKAQIEKELPKPMTSVNIDGVNWLICQIIKREAQQTILGTATTAPTTQGN